MADCDPAERMDLVHQRILSEIEQKCLITKSVNSKVIYPWLLSYGALDQDDADSIAAERTSTLQTQQLFSILRRQNMSIFKKLQEAAFRTKQEGFFDEIRYTLVEKGERRLLWTSPYSWEKVRDVPITEAEKQLTKQDMPSKNQSTINTPNLKEADGKASSSVHPKQVAFVQPISNFHPNEVYPRSATRKDYALIINNRVFARLNERVGTEKDVEKMKELFVTLGYWVEVKENLTASKMVKAASKFASKQEHEECHSAVIIILTHGNKDGLCGTDANEDGSCGIVPVESIIECFNSEKCKQLKNKPKLFFIQACRGGLLDPGVDGIGEHNPSADWKLSAKSQGTDHIDSAHAANMVADKFEEDGPLRSFVKTPTNSDIFIAYSTTQGYVSFRPTGGSWFMQSIHEVFKENAQRLDLCHLLIKVNNCVSRNVSLSQKVQMSETRHTLRKQFYFSPIENQEK